MNTIKIFIFALLVCASLNEKAHPLHKEMMEFISSQPMETQFKLWHFAFKRPYEIDSELGKQKYEVFQKNTEYIKNVNSQNLSYTVGLGPFTDLTFEEFSKSYLGTKPEAEISDSMIERANEEYNMPENKRRKLDWFDDMVDAEEKNVEANIQSQEDDDDEYESPDYSSLYDGVKAQLDCGSCWAFGTIGGVEGRLRQLGSKLVLSEQQLVDCNISSYGCQGGTNESALKYMKQFGLMSEDDYPYEGFDDECKYDESKVKVRGIYRYCSIYGYFCNSKIIKKHIKTGPYTTSINATKAMQHYRDGSITKEKCHTINHSVVVVQVLKDKVKIRNSWGAHWGDNGYGYINIKQDGLPACGALALSYQVDPDHFEIVDQ